MCSDSTCISLNSQLDDKCRVLQWSRKTGLKDNNMYNKHADLMISLYDGPYNVLLTFELTQLVTEIPLFVHPV